MKKSLLHAAILVLSPLLLSSCFIQAVVDTFVRDEYPGQQPPCVIRDVNGKPAPGAQWRKIDTSDLPPSNALRQESTGRAADGLPYGISTGYSNIVISPYYPNYPLDYTGVEPGSKVWDPYTRKAFYISRTYTFN